MPIYQNWSDAITASFQNAWQHVVAVLPTAIGVIIILAIGLALARALGALVSRLIRAAKVDELFDRTGLPQRAQSSGWNLKLSTLLGWLVKWFIVVVTLLTIADILHWNAVTVFLGRVALYIPNVLVAMIILTVGFIVGRGIRTIVERTVAASRLPNSSAGLLSTVAESAIIIFTILAAVTQLGIAPRLVEIFFTGIVVAIALAVGLAFGLGGKDKAAQWLEQLDREIQRDNRQ